MLQLKRLTLHSLLSYGNASSYCSIAVVYGTHVSRTSDFCYHTMMVQLCSPTTFILRNRILDLPLLYQPGENGYPYCSHHGWCVYPSASYYFVHSSKYLNTGKLTCADIHSSSVLLIPCLPLNIAVCRLSHCLIIPAIVQDS